MQKLGFNNAKSVRELINASFSSSVEHRLLSRLHCVLLVAEACSSYEVARWFDKDPRTVERWVHAFEKHGIGGLREHYAGGRPAKLAGAHAQRLALDLQKSPHLCGYAEHEWSGKRVAQHLESRYGITLSPRQCQRMLRRLAESQPPRVA